MEISLSRPDITAKEIEAANAVLRTSYLSIGPVVERFERAFAEYIGARYAVAVSSGTAGLHLAVIASGIHEGDEVITTPFSFIASANCILYERAKPVFVDIDPNTLNIDVNGIEEKITPSTKAILPVHVFGQPCEMDEILAIAQRYDLKVIEDACEAIGAEYLSSKSEIPNPKPEIGEGRQRVWRKVGTFGDCGVFAFYPNKQITTGEGGMIVTDNQEIAEVCGSLRNQGRSENGKWLLHERLGYNYRISEINCALGIAQLERIDKILKKREQVAFWYKERLREIPGIKIPYMAPNCRISWFVYVIRLEDEFTQAHRDKILEELLARGIGCNNYFPPIHLQPLYVKLFGYKKGDSPVTEHVAERTIALPFYTRLSEGQVDYVVSKLKESVLKFKIKKELPLQRFIHRDPQG